MIVVTRRYGFPAAHVLAQPAFGEERNRLVFGKCAHPAGHGHDYALEVSVTGPVDPQTGRVVDPEVLDRVVRERVLQRLSHRLLNDLDCFAGLVPTAENIARVIHGEIQAAIDREGGPCVAGVRLTETPRNHVDYGEAT